MDYKDWNDSDGTEFEFELMNSENGLHITLVCRSDKPLEPYDYAQALRAYADRIDSILSIGDLSAGTLN